MSIRIARRSANYSKHELDCLLTYLEENPDLVSIKLGGQYETPNDIRAAWDDVAEKITAVGGGYFGSKRTGIEVKRKWSDLKSRVKAKAASLAMEAAKPDGGNPNLKLTPMEERVLTIINLDLMDQKESAKSPSVKVFSFHNDSNSGDGPDFDFAESEGQIDSTNESGILEEIKFQVSGSEDKKRRISEAFSAERKGIKRAKAPSEEEQINKLCEGQSELNAELRSMKDILKKCQLSVEKIALLKRAELRLKCAKYGVDFEDLFD